MECDYLGNQRAIHRPKYVGRGEGVWRAEVATGGGLARLADVGVGVREAGRGLLPSRRIR